MALSAAQISEQITVLKSQHAESLLKIQKEEPGSESFTKLALGIQGLLGELKRLESSHAVALENEKSAEQKAAEQKAAAEAEAAAKAQALTAARIERYVLLDTWLEASQAVYAAIVAWNAYTKSDTYAMLPPSDKPSVAGAGYSTEGWERRIPFPSRNEDDTWVLMLEETTWGPKLG